MSEASVEVDRDVAGQRMRPGPAIAAISLAVACGVPGYTAGVFLPAGPGSQALRTSAEEAGQSRLVRIADGELQRARAEVGELGRSRLLLNLSEGSAFDVEVKHTAQTRDGYTLSGNIDGGKGGFVTLAVHKEAVAGSIWTWGGAYEVAPVNDGVHVVRQVTDEPLECGGVLQAPSVELDPRAPTNSADEEAAVVDILVLWTPALEAVLGGESRVKLSIELNIAYTNDALERSGAFVSLNLIGTARVDIHEVNPYDVIREEVLARVHAFERADTLGADFISVFSTGHSISLASGHRGTPVSIFNSSRVAASSTFAHEIGHNLGLLHDRRTHLTPSYSYNGGYVSVEAHYGLTRCYRTIMAYEVGCLTAGLPPDQRIPYYSTRSRYDPATGTPLGVSRLSSIRGWDGPADSVLAINLRRHRSANVRPRRATQ